MLPRLYRMARLWPWCAMMLTVAAAAVVATAATPTAAMKAYYEAVKNKDYAAIKELLSEEYLKELSKAPFPLERVLQPLTERVPPTLPEMRNEKIDGDRATLEMRNHETKQWETIRFVKQKGGWKLAPHEKDK